MNSDQLLTKEDVLLAETLISEGNSMRAVARSMGTSYTHLRNQIKGKRPNKCPNCGRKLTADSCVSCRAMAWQKLKNTAS